MLTDTQLAQNEWQEHTGLTNDIHSCLSMFMSNFERYKKNLKRKEKWMNIWLPYVIWSVGRRKVQNKYFQHELIKVLKEFSINILTRRRVWKNLRHKQYYQSFNCVLNIKIFHCTHVINEQSKSELPLFSFCTYTK